MKHNPLESYFIANATKHNVPISGSIELLPLCNMNCDMCYVRLSHSEMEKYGSLLTPKEWIDIGRQMQQNGTLFLQITGGEPLLYRGFKDVFLALKQMGIILTINTNGTLLDGSWAEFFAHNKPRRINITLYGSSSITYNKLCHYAEGFDRTLKAIKLLKEQGVDVKINGSLVKANQADLEHLLDIAHELEIPINIDTYMFPASRDRERAYNRQSRLTPEEIAKSDIEIKKHELSETDFRNYADFFLYKAEHPETGETPPDRMKCHSGRSSFFINWHGQMQPCVMLSENAVSIADYGFAQAWKIISDRVKNIRLSPVCAKCLRRDVCQTCAACALLESGQIDGVPEYMCRYTNAKIELLKEELANE